MPPMIYWDSCCFISLIQREKGRYSDTREIYDEAERGKLIIVTSTLTLSEVCKVRCDEGAGKPRASLSEDGDSYLDRFFDNDFFRFIELSPTIAKDARSLFRAHSMIKVTNDAVHLATAIRENVDEMHTYDGNDLIDLSKQVRRKDGQPLLISIPRSFQRSLLPRE